VQRNLKIRLGKGATWPFRKNALKTTFATRLRKIIDQCHNGSQAVAAIKWGSTTATISRVYNGLNIPRTQLVQQICRTPGLNIAWFITGVGKPFDNINEIKLPVFNTLLPQRLTKEHSAALGYRKTVRYREADTRYWYYALHHSVMFNSGDRQLMQQYLLVETDAEYIDRHLHAHSIVSVMLPNKNPVFARVSHRDQHGIRLKLFNAGTSCRDGGATLDDIESITQATPNWLEYPYDAKFDREFLGNIRKAQATWTIHLTNTKDILGLVIAREEDNG
jgi:hypothetical protein